MNLEFLRFFYGTEENYNEYIKSLTALDDSEKEEILENCFFYTIDTDNISRLRLGQILISSNLQVELLNGIMSSNDFKNFLNDNYLSVTITDQEQTIQSPLTIKKTVKINDNLTVENDFSSGNIQYNQMEKKVIFNSEKVDEVNATKFTSQNLNVTNSAEIANASIKDLTVESFSKLPAYSSTAGYGFDFNSGTLKINSIDAQSININGAEIPVINNESTLTIKSLRIGNILLEDEDGNLKITVV